MPKAGKYEYPFFDLDACLEKLKIFYDKTKSDQTTRSIVADALNMKEKGGGFAYLISSMEKYGLVQTGGGNITVTDLGKLLMYGEPKEKEQARSRAVANVELFRDIAQKYGKNPQSEQVKMFLREKANMDVVEAQKIAPSVNKIYKKVSNYLTSADKLAPPSKESFPMVPSLGRSDTFMQPDQAKIELLKIQYGDFYIQVTKEDAEYALRLVAQKLGIKFPKEKTD
jgi:hypothetical protein